MSLSRRRRMRPPRRAELPEVASSVKDHDLLVFPGSKTLNKWEYFRVPVTKQTSTGPTLRRAGEFNDPPEKWDLLDHGERRVLNVATPAPDAANADARGPAFALLPVKPDPGSASFPTCYLINVDQLQNPNLWTVEEWNDGPDGPNFPTPPHPNGFEVLIAGPRGKVFRLLITDLDRWKNETQPFTYGEVEDVSLKHEPEIWQQLRNGCIAGRVQLNELSHELKQKGSAKPRVVPLVNITALDPQKEKGK